MCSCLHTIRQSIKILYQPEISSNGDSKFENDVSVHTNIVCVERLRRTLFLLFVAQYGTALLRYPYIYVVDLYNGFRLKFFI